MAILSPFINPFTYAFVWQKQKSTSSFPSECFPHHVYTEDVELGSVCSSANLKSYQLKKFNFLSVL